MNGRVFAGALALLVALIGPTLAAAPAAAAIGVSNLPGYAGDDHRAALAAFAASCAAPPPERPALPPPAALASVCGKALALSPTTDDAGAAAFFAANFEARRVGVADAAFFTGYYEPVVLGSLAATSKFGTPLYPAPQNLVRVTPGRTPGLDPTLTVARRRVDGALEALPDRGAIEAGALRETPLVYVGDPVEAFFIQVQGSARVQLPDGSSRRLVYAGRNGYPYTAIGKLLVERLGIPPAAMGMAQLRAWLRAVGEAPDQPGGVLMRRNRSYIFFRFDESLPPGAGPIGGEGISLTPLRSLAVDRAAWPWGLPFWVDATMPWAGAEPSPFRRLMIGQDTGAAIVGAARGDIFFGTGDAAAVRAGPIRAHGTLTVLWPR